MPNYRVEQQRLKMQIAAQEHAVEQRKLEIMEMVDRKNKATEQIQAAKQAIAHMTKSLSELIKNHGPIYEEDTNPK